MSQIIRSTNLDANESVFFSRQLEQIKAQTYDVVYPDLQALNLMPTSNEAGAGANSITYRQFDRRGQAEVISDFGQDLPRSDIVAKEFPTPIVSVGASYGYSVQEIRAAQFAGLNLEQRKANVCRRSVEERINRMAWYGDSNYNISGLLNHPDIVRTAVPDDGTGPSRNFADKTAEQILRDLNETVHAIVRDTNMVEQPDTLLLPVEQRTLIQSTRLASGTDTTIEQYFLNNNGYINEIVSVNELAGAGTGDGVPTNAGEDVMVAFTRSADKLTLEIPQMFEQFPAQERGLEFIVPCHARTAGVLIYYPRGVAIAEGI